MKKQLQRGFTLIELVMVIVILGVLAAVALPKFTSFKTDAETATAAGLAGAIASGASIQYAKNSLDGSGYSYAAACSATSAYLATTNFGTCQVGAPGAPTCTVTCGGGTMASVTLP